MEVTITLSESLERIVREQAKHRSMPAKDLCKELLELALLEIGLPFKLVPSRAELEGWFAATEEPPEEMWDEKVG